MFIILQPVVLYFIEFVLSSVVYCLSLTNFSRVNDF